MAADRQIQQQVKPLIERRRIGSTDRIPLRLRLVAVPIDDPLDLPFFPLDGKRVEVVGEASLGNWYSSPEYLLLGQ